MVNVDYVIVKFPVSKKEYNKIEQKNKIFNNVFYYENDLVYLVHVSNEKLEKCMDLLLTTDENKLHYIYINDFNRLMFNKTKNENKKHFRSEKVLIEHKKIFSKINGKQSVTLRSCSIEFKNYFKQEAVLFKIYVDFECFKRSSKQ